MNPHKFMLDSMIYDKIALDPDFMGKLKVACNQGVITVLSTHIQEDQLAATPDPRWRVTLLNTLEAIAPTKVATAGLVWGLSKWGESAWGDGVESGISVGQVDSDARNHTQDALIATTAARDADILVTEETRLQNRLRALGTKCEVWDFERFKAYVLSCLKE